jgi:hypothetical protein
MSAATLASFLNMLASNAEDLDRFNTDQDWAMTKMVDWGLNAAERSAILNHDVTALYKLLTPEESESTEAVETIFIPFGPVRLVGPGPVRFFQARPDDESERALARRQGTLRPKRSGQLKTATMVAGRKRVAKKSAKKKSQKKK